MSGCGAGREGGVASGSSSSGVRILRASHAVRVTRCGAWGLRSERSGAAREDCVPSDPVRHVRTGARRIRRARRRANVRDRSGVHADGPMYAPDGRDVQMA
eukprot:355027-Chlamydomonas_euryale.AAC.8